MSGTSKLLLGAAAGFGLMYFIERPFGNRRRALVRDQVSHLVHETGDAARIVSHDLENRSRGVLARVRRAFATDGADDAIVRERVRSALGRHCSHPHAIETAVHDGRLELDGAILAAEREPLVTALSRVRGVREIADRLTVHQSPDIALLQGRRRITPRVKGVKGTDGLDESWSATTRFLAGTVGAIALVRGAAGGGPLGLGLGLLGAGLVGRSLANRPLGRLIGLRGSDITIQKTIEIARPIEDVWAYLTAFEQYPRFMSHVAEVRRIDGVRFHWKVEGPMGTTFEWDGIVTQRFPYELLSWRSARGASIQNAGRVRFESISPGLTRVQVMLRYSPPAGVLGHAFASLFGADPKHALDDDFMRLQSLLEHGRTTGHERVSEEEMTGRLSH